jgi:hypothetical protein
MQSFWCRASTLARQPGARSGVLRNRPLRRGRSNLGHKPYKLYSLYESDVIITYEKLLQGLAVGGHDGSFLIVDRVGSVGVVIGVRSHTGEVLSVYLSDADIEKVV